MKKALIDWFGLESNISIAQRQYDNCHYNSTDPEKKVFANSFLMRAISMMDVNVFYSLSLVSRPFALYSVLGQEGKAWRKVMKRRFAVECGWTLTCVNRVLCNANYMNRWQGKVQHECLISQVRMYQRKGELNDFAGNPAIRMSYGSRIYFERGVPTLAIDKKGRRLTFKKGIPDGREQGFIYCIPRFVENACKEGVIDRKTGQKQHYYNDLVFPNNAKVDLLDPIKHF